MKKILLIDDSRAALAAIKSQLPPDDFEVLTTQSPSEGLRFLEDFRADCILTDFEMPELTGPELCKILKANEKFMHIPVIVLTSKSETDYLLEAIGAGADDFISKDSDARVIVAKINAMLRIKQMHDELSQLRRVSGIKQIMATYNHEFNNPLAIAIGNLSFLKGAITDQNLLGKVTRAYDALDRMAVIVRKIRDLRDYIEEDYSKKESMVSLKRPA